jgi:hypothetical protein
VPLPPALPAPVRERYDRERQRSEWIPSRLRREFQIANIGPQSEPDNAVRFGVLTDLVFPGIQSTNADLQAAARTLGLQLVVVDARTDSDLEPAIATLSQQRVGAILVGNGNLYTRRMEQLATLAARHALPAIFPYREFALAGGLMSYGSSIRYFYHQVGIYTGRTRDEPGPELRASRWTCWMTRSWTSGSYVPNGYVLGEEAGGPFLAVCATVRECSTLRMPAISRCSGRAVGRMGFWRGGRADDDAGLQPPSDGGDL